MTLRGLAPDFGRSEAVFYLNALKIAKMNILSKQLTLQTLQE